MRRLFESRKECLSSPEGGTTGTTARVGPMLIVGISICVRKQLVVNRKQIGMRQRWV